MRIKLISFLMALLLVLCAASLVACDNGGGDLADTTTPVADTTPPVAADTTTAAEIEVPADTTAGLDLTARDLSIVSGGKTSVRVIRSEELTTDDAQVTYASDICNAVKTVSGVMPRMATDWLNRGSEYDHETVEILVGYTEYPESKLVMSELSYGGYAIKVVGNKLVIAAHSQVALDTAYRQAKNLFSKSFSDGELTIPADTYISGVANTMLDSLPVYKSEALQYVYNGGRDVKLIIANDTAQAQYEEYLKTLEVNGWKQYTTNVIAGNHFAIYNNDKYTVNVGFYAYEDAVRISIEPLAEMVGLEKDNVYTPITTSQITMLGMEYGSEAIGGQSMLIRLTDGRFIVIDGGHHPNTGSKSAELLVEALKEQSRDYLKTGEKITIAAWFITHTHTDHTGMLVGNFAKFKDMKIEKFLVNFISQDEHNRSMNSTQYGSAWTASSGNGWKQMQNIANALGTKLQTVHVGQTFYLANVKMDILYTLESYAPKVCNTFNTSSITAKFTFDTGDTCLITGDTTGFGLDIVNKMFGDYIKSDIVQISHHGANTGGYDRGTMSFYTTAAPKTLLWPVGPAAYAERTQLLYNKTAFSVDAGGKNVNFKESLMAGYEGERVILPIPYTVGSAIEVRR